MRCLYFVFGEQFVRLRSLARALARRCSLTLDGLFEIAHRCAPSNACCACTHYLVFKEPEAQRPAFGVVRRAAVAAVPSDRRSSPLLGEPFEVTTGPSGLSTLFRGRPPENPDRVFVCVAVEISRPINHCRAGARQANLSSLRRPSPCVNAAYRAMVSVTEGGAVAPKLMLPKPVCHRRAPAWDLKHGESTWPGCASGT